MTGKRIDTDSAVEVDAVEPMLASLFDFSYEAHF
jgi:hypothetical protein